MKTKIDNWPTALFLVITPLVAVIATVFYLTNGMSNTATWILTAIMFTVTGLATTAGYHRLFSHQAYQASWPVRLLMLVFGSAAWQGSALEWSIDHRNHHRFVDTDKDPYSIKKGFGWAHMGWLFFKRPRDFSPEKNPDLFADKLVIWQSKYDVLIGILVGFALPTLVAGLFWGDWFGGFFIAGVLRAVLSHHATFCINSVAHTFGKQPYSDKHTAKDNWVNALVTWGEGYHNYHHEFASDYRNAIRWWQYDPTKWLIFILSKLNLASNLKRVGTERILVRKMNTLEKRMPMFNMKLHLPARRFEQLQKYREKFRATSADFANLRKRYEAASRQRSQQMQAQLHEMQISLKQAKEDLIESFTDWERSFRKATLALQPA